MLSHGRVSNGRVGYGSLKKRDEVYVSQLMDSVDGVPRSTIRSRRGQVSRLLAVSMAALLVLLACCCYLYFITTRTYRSSDMYQDTGAKFTANMLRFEVLRRTSTFQRPNSDFFLTRHTLHPTMLARFDPSTSDWDVPPSSSVSSWNAGWDFNHHQNGQPQAAWDPYVDLENRENPAFVALNNDKQLVAYNVQLDIGNPPQTVVVLLDTGSGNLEVNSIRCANCDSPNKFDAEQSSSIRLDVCQNTFNCACQSFANCYCHQGLCAFNISFADKTGRAAHLVTDAVQMGQISVTTAFGLIYDQWGKMFKDYDGTMGLAYGPTLMAKGSSWLLDLFRIHDFPHVFTLCMGLYGGQLTLGGIDESLFLGTILYTPIMNTGFYTVPLLAIEVRTHSGLKRIVPIFSDRDVYPGTILDTGSTATYLSPVNYDPLREAILDLCQESKEEWLGLCDAASNREKNLFTEECIAVPRAEFLKWPTLIFHFQAAGNEPAPYVQLQPHQYMTPKTLSHRHKGSTHKPSKKENVWCIGFYRGEPGSGINLGDTFIRSVYVVHDLDRMLVGFAQPHKGNCRPRLIRQQP